PDGREKKAVSPVEAFYERMSRRSAERAKARDNGLFGPLKPGSDDPRDGLSHRSEERLPGELRERVHDLRQMMKSDWDGTKEAPQVSESMSWDMFNLNKKTDAVEERGKARKNMMDECRTMSGMPTSASELSPQTLYPQPANPFAT